MYLFASAKVQTGGTEILISLGLAGQSSQLCTNRFLRHSFTSWQITINIDVILGVKALVENIMIFPMKITLSAKTPILNSEILWILMN